MRVLITGAAGFIGSNLYRRCLAEGWDVTGVDDLSNGHAGFLPQQSDCHFKDFTDPALLDLVRVGCFDVVFHLAAVPRVSYSVEHPLETNDTNVSKTLQLLEACRSVTYDGLLVERPLSRMAVKRVVFASSSSVYGGASELPTPEEAPRAPKSPYALQKAIVEDYLALYGGLYGLDSVCLRFFNVFGPHQLGDSPYSTAVSAWLTAIKRGVPMRSDGDGHQTRDMCYVDNVTEACVLAAKASGTYMGRCYNVACGERTSNKEILDRLLERYPGASYATSPWRQGDVMHTQADITRINAELGYRPLVRFWEGLDRTIGWFEREWSSIKDMGLQA